MAGASLSIPLEQEQRKSKLVAIIVAHPDDETLWAGGNILSHSSWQCFIVCLCRRSDAERVSRFYDALKILRSDGAIGDLNDGPEQTPLQEEQVEQAILDLLPAKHYDLIITHNPSGEYTKHIRHEEISKAVIKLWDLGRISVSELRTFAYEDGCKQYYPKSIEDTTICEALTEELWQKKYRLITETYGFEKDSWEAETTPRTESFWQFTNSHDATIWLNNGGTLA